MTFSEIIGIPYAKAPVGNLRFAKPQPTGAFKNGAHNATEFGSFCPQIQEGKQIGEEDCLFLNIYVPGGNNNKLKVCSGTDNFVFS